MFRVRVRPRMGPRGGKKGRVIVKRINNKWVHGWCKFYSIAFCLKLNHRVEML